MTDIHREVIDGLTAALTSLLPTVPDLTLRPILMVNPVRITPTGLGGYVGPSTDPAGDVVGRRLEARVTVTVKAGDDDGLSAAVSEVTHALMGAERRALLERGILRLALGELGPGATGSPGAQVARREVDFSVLYEHLREPEAGEGIIRRIPLHVGPFPEGAAPAEPAPPPPPPPPPPAPAPLLSGDFTAESFALFEAVDDPLTSRRKPSAWSFSAAEGRAEERSGIWGGANRTPSLRPGTYLVLRTGDAIPALDDFDVTARMEAGAAGGIGLVFRWQDVDNFYFFLMDAKRSSRIIGKKVAGSFSELEVPAQDLATGFSTGAVHTVRLTARGGVFEVELDGTPALRGEDASLAGPGRVGLMARDCGQAFFYGVELLPA